MQGLVATHFFQILWSSHCTQVRISPSEYSCVNRGHCNVTSKQEWWGKKGDRASRKPTLRYQEDNFPSTYLTDYFWHLSCIAHRKQEKKLISITTIRHMRPCTCFRHDCYMPPHKALRSKCSQHDCFMTNYGHGNVITN